MLYLSWTLSWISSPGSRALCDGTGKHVLILCTEDLAAVAECDW